MSRSASEVNETGKRGVSRGGEGERRAVEMAANALHWSFCVISFFFFVSLQISGKPLTVIILKEFFFRFFSIGKLPKYVEKISSVTEILIFFVGFIDTLKPRRSDEIENFFIRKNTS